MRKRLSTVLAILAMSGAVSAGAADGSPAREVLVWSQLPPLPPAPGQAEQIGVAGAFAGVHNDALIVAGGANFPRGLPWETLADGFSPPKVYHKNIFVLVKVNEGGQGEQTAEGKDVDGSQRYKWIDSELQLDQPWSYGVSIPTAEGLVCLGGEWKDTENYVTVPHLSQSVFVLKWDAKTQTLERTNKLVGADESPDEVEPLAELPSAVYGMGGARVGDRIYLCGGGTASGATTNFWMLDLSKKKDGRDFGWKVLPAWPGPPRFYPIVAAQSDGTDDCLYLFSGRNVQPDEPTELLTDAYKYNPKTEEWTRLPDIAPAGETPRCVMAGTGIASGVNHILIFGGADGKLFLELESLDRRIAAAQGGEARALRKRKVEILENHPGFSRDVLAFHTITNTWARVGELPTGSHVTTTAVKWGDAFVIPSGEIRPGVRSPTVWKAVPPKPAPFGGLDFAVLGIYLLALVGMGVYFSRRMHSTDDFFKAGRRIPWWAAGLSIYATQLSAITFMAIPAKTFATDWRYFMGNMAIVAVAPFIVYWFLPFYRRLNVTTAYEYLEVRFNVGCRLFGSLAFMLLQFCRIGIVLLLPSIALSVATGMDVELCVVLMGVLCIIYTVLGGMEAVVWTDVMQTIVLLGGALLCLLLIPFRVPGGWNAMMDLAEGAGRLRMLDFRLSLTEATFFVLLFGAMAQNFFSYGADQVVIQRYLTTRDEKTAARSIWTNAIMVIPGSMLFFMIGTALFAFYATHPAEMNPTLSNAHAVFPYFIVTQLPAGIAGLVIAGLFAASMSSLDSSMNSVSTAITTDFYRRFRRQATEHSCLVLARWLTVIVGGVGTGVSLLLAGSDVASLWDASAFYVGLFGSGLAGIFLLGIFTRRAHGRGALIGFATGSALQIGIKFCSPIHSWLYALTNLAFCFLLGYLASLLIPARRKPDDGLTIYTLAQSEK